MRETVYTPWETAALSALRSRPNPDGSYGFALSDSPQAVEWHGYFQANDMPQKAAFLKSRVMAGNAYLVPTEWPDQFDASWRRNRHSHGFRKPSDMSAERRAELANALRTGFRQSMPDDQLAA